MKEDDEDPQQGGGGAAGVWLFLQSLIRSVLLFGAEKWVVTTRMGREVHWGVPGTSGASIHGADPAAAVRRGVGVHLGGDDTGGGRF